MAQWSSFDAVRDALSRVLRVAVPLGALVLLSTVFLVSRSIDPERAVDMADIDVAELTREPRIGAARFAGVTQDNTALVIAARSVRSAGDVQQDGPIHLTLDAPVGELHFSTGRIAGFQAEEGLLDQDSDELRLTGNVVLTTSDGYVARMPELVSAMQRTHVVGTGGVTGRAPAGEIEADSVELTAKTDADDGYLLAFKGNVRLIYLPED